MLHAMWAGLKVWRKVKLGPVSFVFSFRRSITLREGAASQGARARHSVRPAVADGRDPVRPHIRSAVIPESAGPSLGIAVLVGVGPGFGDAVARRLAASGYDLALVSRNADRLVPLAADLRSLGRTVEAYGADATDESHVLSLFRRIEGAQGIPSLVVYCIQEFGPGEATEVTVPAFESAWRHNCLGAFLVSRAAARSMQPRGTGSIFFIGSTSSILARAGHLNLAVGKFGQRALAQVLSRELWPKGLHVAHIIIDADISETGSVDPATPQSNPDDIAVSLLAVHQQPRTAWTSEIDLRPWNERFWEHC